MMGDVNGDGRADIVGFSNSGVSVALGEAATGLDSQHENPNNSQPEKDNNNELDVCQRDTPALDLEIDTGYDQRAITRNNITDMDGTRRVFIDFSTNVVRSAGYEAQCVRGNRGRVERVSYEATCNSAADSEIILHVLEQPRCYATSCDSTDEATNITLLNEFTVQPTQDLTNLDSDVAWECHGALRADVQSAYEYQTEELYLMNEVAEGNFLQTPSVNVRNFPLVIPTSTSTVRFSDSEELWVACDGSEGRYQEWDDFKTVCADPAGEETMLEVYGFSACFGASCTDSAPNEKIEIFRQRLVQSGDIESAFECGLSNAWTVSLKVATIWGVVSSPWLGT